MYKVPAVLLVLLLSLYPCALRAQTTNASVTGRVTDPSKAVIGEAKVAAVNLGTNFRYESTTNTARDYTLPNLPPGIYRMEVEKFNSAAFLPLPLASSVISGGTCCTVSEPRKRMWRSAAVCVHEQVNLRFRGEFFNIFNHSNFGPPISSLTSPLFGHSTETLASSLGWLQSLVSDMRSRSIQLALRLAL